MSAKKGDHPDRRPPARPGSRGCANPIGKQASGQESRDRQNRHLGRDCKALGIGLREAYQAPLTESLPEDMVRLLKSLG